MICDVFRNVPWLNQEVSWIESDLIFKVGVDREEDTRSECWVVYSGVGMVTFEYAAGSRTSSAHGLGHSLRLVSSFPHDTE